MDYTEFNFDEEFNQAFIKRKAWHDHSRGKTDFVVLCEFCSTTHVAAAPNTKASGALNPGFTPTDLLDYYEAEKRGNNVIVHPNLGNIRFGFIDGVKFVEICKCKKWLQYQHFLVNNREGIEEFMRLISSKISLANAFANNDLSNTSSPNPDYEEDEAGNDDDDIPF